MKSILIIGMGKFGHHLCADLIKNGNDIMVMDKDCLLYTSDVYKRQAYDFDESKIIIFTKEAMNGHTLLELLLKKYELQLEMAAGNYVLALASVMDTDEGMSLIHILGEEMTMEQTLYGVMLESANE